MIKDDCDKAWDELYGEEYGMSDALPCEPYYGFFCAGWNKAEDKLKCCENCKHHSFWGDELKCNLDLDTQFKCLHTKEKWELAE